MTLNPCLDKTLTVPRWRAGDNVRGRGIREVVGGKGNNVARALKRLGKSARPATFLGGPVGLVCERLLRGDDGFDPIVTPTEAPTRVILTARTEGSDEQTAFFDPDPAVTAAEAENLYNRVEGAFLSGGVDALTLSGSSPSPATHGLYSDLIALAQTHKTPVFLDTYGPALQNVWGFWPDAMQVNRREAALHLDRPDPSEAERFELLRRWSRHGVAWGVVTDGPHPACVRLRGVNYRVTMPAITPVNPIGSGDSLLAGLVAGWLDGLGPEALIRQAFGAGLANALVWDAGGIDAGEVARLGGQVRVEVPE